MRGSDAGLHRQHAGPSGPARVFVEGLQAVGARLGGGFLDDHFHHRGLGELRVRRGTQRGGASRIEAVDEPVERRALPRASNSAFRYASYARFNRSR